MANLFWENKKYETLSGEIWVDAFGFDGLYEVSNKGRVRSLDRYIKCSHGERLLKGRVLSQCKITHKYSGSFSLYVNLANGDGTYSIKTMALLVLNSFKKPDEYNNSTHHINGVSHDNRLENLAFEDMSTKRKIDYDIGLRDGARNTKHWKDSGFPMKKSKEEMIRMSALIKSGSGKFEKRNKKPVTVYIAKGNIIRTYTCIRNASEQLGIKEYTLRNALLKPRHYQYIQVKEGMYNIEEFNPKPKRNENKIIFKNVEYSFTQFSNKYNVPISTMYYKFKKLGIDNFKIWIEEVAH